MSATVATPTPVSSRVLRIQPAARTDLTTQRSAHTVSFQPKYGADRTSVQAQYLWTGAPNTPTIIVQGGISASRDVVGTSDQGGKGWWADLVGEAQAIDLATHRILAIEWLIPSDFDTAPLAVSSEDQADALAALLDDLGIAQVEAFIGSSYGAMVGLAFAARHKARAQKLVLIAGAHKAHPLSTAQRSIQRQIVQLGLATGQGTAALALARQLAMTTYRGEEEFGRRFAAGPELIEGRFQFPVESYLAHAGQQFVARFSPERFLALSESIDLHDVTPEHLTDPVTLIAFPSDRLVPLADVRALSARLNKATLEVVDSPYGHDAFLKEPDAVARIIQRALAIETPEAA